MAIIELKNGLKVYFDDEDNVEVSKHKWYLHSGGYATNGKSVLMHRLIMGMPKDFDVDHINGNKLDNRKDNLRVCHDYENLANSKLNSRNKTGFKGVHYYKAYGLYQAYVNFRKKRYNLGYFESAIEAADAYNQKCKAIKGTFAKLN